jgi:hypothetical protein
MNRNFSTSHGLPAVLAWLYMTHSAEAYNKMQYYLELHSTSPAVCRTFRNVRKRHAVRTVCVRVCVAPHVDCA